MELDTALISVITPLQKEIIPGHSQRMLVNFCIFFFLSRGLAFLRRITTAIPYNNTSMVIHYMSAYRKHIFFSLERNPLEEILNFTEFITQYGTNKLNPGNYKEQDQYHTKILYEKMRIDKKNMLSHIVK